MEKDDFTPSTPHDPLAFITVTIREFCEQRNRFKIDPPFQRKKAWTKIDRQAFIDSLLKGDPIPPWEAYDDVDEHGRRVYVMIDGHQRSEAILDFYDGKFRTWTPAEKGQAEPDSDPPVEPRKTIEILSPHAKDNLLDRQIQINRIRKTSDKQIRTRFLRIQNSKPLTMAEKLNSFTSKANTVARRIEQHSFWEEVYEGRTNREQILQCSLQLLAIELATPTGIGDLHSLAALQTLASGKRDKEITDATVDAVLIRLDLMSHVYHGLHFTIRAACIPMYQSIMFLEQADYSIKQDDKRKLTNWMKGLITASQRASGLPSYERPIQQLTYARHQRAFWARHLKSMLAQFGIREPAA